MPTTLDGRTIDLAVSADETLHAFLQRVGGVCEAGRLIVGVTVDGQPLVEDELAERLPCPLRGDEQIVVESASPAEVAGSALQVIAENLRSSAGALPALADRMSGTEPPVDALCGYLDVWRNCQEAIANVSQLLGRDVLGEAVDGRTVGEHLVGLVEKLRELRDAFEARDTVLLADVLRYEWPELSEQWSQMLDTLAGRVRP